ncbi:1-phosphofructokinase family hexose kinase [Phenylobacterium sp.]|uniref:1-phosphofructokinase family hexose kinase n=1 Tax=Phenylobacterium sp. TaxID=1871053 RepID=UPI00391AC8B1
MPVIATLTMNPALDMSTSAERVEPVRKLRCSPARRDPGGGGVNVARMAHRLGARTIAIFPSGGLTGQMLERLVEAEGVEATAVAIGSETREDVTVLDETSGEQYRFVLPGPHLHGVEWMACLRTLAELPTRPDIFCASGSLPPGVPDDFYARVAEIVESWGVRFALDTSGAPLKAALAERVFLVKPNLRELRELTGAPLSDEPSRVAACRALIARGRLGAVALSLGHEGALLVTAHDAWRAQALPIRPVSSVGAGDSFLGAMLWGLASKLTLKESFNLAMAGGSAALLAPGTELARSADVRRLLAQVIVEPVPEPRAAAVGR